MSSPDPTSSTVAMSSLAASVKGAKAATKPDQVQILARHILRQLARHRNEADVGGASAGAATATIGKGRLPPLIVGVQGPQGSGKTTVTLALRDLLAQAPHSLRVAAFSIDDLYLPHSGLVSVASSDASNVLLSGRGQPGTHDVLLGSDILRSLSSLNTEASSDSNQGTVHIPTFDKSRFEGQGDRGEKTIKVTSPLDVVLFEGWCLGFAPLGPAALAMRYKVAKEQWEAEEDKEGKSRKPYFLSHPLEHLQRIDKNLDQWKEAWYRWIQCFVQLVPITEEEAADAERQHALRRTESREEGEDDVEAAFPPAPPKASAQSLETVFQWRAEAERKMKASNGGKGMSEDEVRKFVERYMPGYELFSDGVNGKEMPWHGRGVRVALDEKRSVRGVGRF